MGQLNQLPLIGKQTTKAPLRPRALRITVRGPDHFSGGRAVSGKQRNFRSFQRQLQKQKPGAWPGWAKQDCLLRWWCRLRARHPVELAHLGQRMAQLDVQGAQLLAHAALVGVARYLGFTCRAGWAG